MSHACPQLDIIYTLWITTDRTKFYPCISLLLITADPKVSGEGTLMVVSLLAGSSGTEEHPMVRGGGGASAVQSLLRKEPV